MKNNPAIDRTIIVRYNSKGKSVAGANFWKIILKATKLIISKTKTEDKISCPTGFLNNPADFKEGTTTATEEDINIVPTHTLVSQL